VAFRFLQFWKEDRASKLLLENLATGMQVRGFLSEALVMRQLKHDNMVTVEDADYTEEDRSFVVMEYRRYLHALPRP
jgi:serine/threonine protein kinase